MTGNEIRNAAEVYLGKNISNDSALIGINEALNKIGEMGLLYGKIRVNAQAGESYSLPKDALHVFSVSDLNGVNYENWSLVGEEIRFADSGEYIISARKLSKKLENLSEEPDIHRVFHQSLVEYLREFASQSFAEFGEKNPDFTMFETSANKAFSFLRRQRQPRQIKVVR